MSPHSEGEKTGTRHNDKTAERKGGTGKKARDRGGETTSKESPLSGKHLRSENAD